MTVAKEKKVPLRIRSFRIRGGYAPRHLFHGARRSSGSVGRLSGDFPPVVTYWTEGTRHEQGELVIRNADVPFLCQLDVEEAKRYLELMLRSRKGDVVAREHLHSEQKRAFLQTSQELDDRHVVENRFIVPCTSQGTYSETTVGNKGSILLRLAKLGYPVPDFVILTSNAHEEWEQHGERVLAEALDTLTAMTGQPLGDGTDPLLLAIRVCMPHYVPGFMPTYLNVGVTVGSLPALEAIYGRTVADKIFLNSLNNIVRLLDSKSFGRFKRRFGPYLAPVEISRLVDHLSDIVRKKDSRLLEDPFYQASFFIQNAHLHHKLNSDVLMTLSRGKDYRPSIILQKMVCSVRDDQSYAGVLFSRHSKTGVGYELQTGRNIFGEAIMTGAIEPEQTCFTDRSEIADTFPAVCHFAQSLQQLEREFESPVTIEFATESIRGHELFALLQLNNMAMTGRAAFISVVNMHKEGTISRRRVTELICPYHVKQIESDTIDRESFKILKVFARGVSVLPRHLVCGKIYFTDDAALNAKRRGETVCFCKKTFAPSDTVVMREMDGIVSLTSAAIHVVTICQSFGMPGLLSLEKSGVTLKSDGCLVNDTGEVIREGDWITISSRRQILYKGRAAFKSARLIRYMRGQPVRIDDVERQSFDDVVYAYRYYQQLVRGLKLDQISKLNELIRLVNLEMRGEVEEARSLVRRWFDGHEIGYVTEVLKSDLGDHLNQYTVFDMLTLDRKIRFFKAALDRCNREKMSGYTAGAFMLGRFIARPQPIAFWRAFDPFEIGLLVNELVLFEKYLQVLHEVGERKIVRAKKKILQEGLDAVVLSAWNVKCLIPLKLSRTPLDEIRELLPEWTDHQTAEVIEMLKRPYRDFYDFDAPWSVQELQGYCQKEDIPVPGPDDT